MTSSGESYTYVDVMTCSATAYTCEGYVGHTYSGTLARVGAIAVDPTVIPLGTKMYVVSNDGQYVYGPFAMRCNVVGERTAGPGAMLPIRNGCR